MTAFTPEIRVMYLPPNTDHEATKTEVTAWVDYNINISRGTSDFISPPYPGTCTLSLLFDKDLIPDIELNSWVQIEVKSSIGIWGAIHAGNVTNRTSSYRSYGLDGYILQWDFQITSPISLLQNLNYTLDSDVTESSINLVSSYITPQAIAFNWTQISNNLTWAAYGPGAWEDVDETREYDYPFIIFDDASPTPQKLIAGVRNVWDDLITLQYGLYGYIIESPDAVLEFFATNNALFKSMTFTADLLDSTLNGNERLDSMRNIIQITKADGSSKTYYDNDSMALYGDRIGSLNTAIVNTADTDVLATKILNALSYPLLSTEQIGFNLLNPSFTGSQRDLMLFDPLGQRVTVQAPIAMGGTLDYLTIGLNYTITKNEFFCSLTLVPYSSVLVSPNWEQIPYNYTWSSYGVAFPTQEWQDL
jgi:hypothetical protein